MNTPIDSGNWTKVEEEFISEICCAWNSGGCAKAEQNTVVSCSSGYSIILLFCLAADISSVIEYDRIEIINWFSYKGQRSRSIS